MRLNDLNLIVKNIRVIFYGRDNNSMNFESYDKVKIITKVL